MTCRHDKNDPACTSSAAGATRLAQKNADGHIKAANERLAELQDRTPDPDEFNVVDVALVGDHLVLKVRYPSCKRCEFDQTKVMVFLGCSAKDALQWRRIDPHFSAGKRANEAPSPAARFPASAEGWRDALEYARQKKRA